MRTILGGSNWDRMVVSLVGACSRAVYVFEWGCYASLAAQLYYLVIIIVI